MTDYLIKAIAFERFLLVAQRVQQRHAANLATTPAPAPDFIFVKADYHAQRLRLADIRYLEGLKGYINIYTGAPRPILT